MFKCLENGIKWVHWRYRLADHALACRRPTLTHTLAHAIRTKSNYFPIYRSAQEVFSEICGGSIERVFMGEIIDWFSGGTAAAAVVVVVM